MIAGPVEQIFLGDDRIDHLPGYARGFAYGDGVFETMRVHRGTVPWWGVHFARLANGLARLRIRLPDVGAMERAIAELFEDGGSGVAKLIVSRGGIGRGYAPDLDAPPLWGGAPPPPPPPAPPPRPRGAPPPPGPDLDAPPLWRVSRHELPPLPRPDGLVLRWCDTRLALQPALAGLKHCNRL